MLDATPDRTRCEPVRFPKEAQNVGEREGTQSPRAPLSAPFVSWCDSESHNSSGDGDDNGDGDATSPFGCIART